MSELLEKPKPCPHCGSMLTSIGVDRRAKIEWKEEDEEDTFEDEELAKATYESHKDENAKIAEITDNLERTMWRVTWKTGNFEDNGQGNVTYTCGICGKAIGGSNANQTWGIMVDEEF